MFPVTSPRKHIASGRSRCLFPFCCFHGKRSARRLMLIVGVIIAAGILLLLLVSVQIDLAVVNMSLPRNDLLSTKSYPRNGRTGEASVSEERLTSTLECAPARFSIELHRPSPVFAPRFIGKALVEEYVRSRGNNSNSSEHVPLAAKNTNDVEIGAEEFERADRNVVRMANVTPGAMRHFESYRTAAESGGVCDAAMMDDNARELSLFLYNNLVNFIVNVTKDVAPIVADYGCRFGSALSSGLRESSVVCFMEEDDDITMTSAGTCGDGSGGVDHGSAQDDGTGSSDVSPCNALRVVVPVERRGSRCPTGNKAGSLRGGGFLGPRIAPLYSSCNVFSVSVISSALTLDPDGAVAAECASNGSTRRGWGSSREDVVELVARTLPISGAVLAIVPRGEEAFDCVRLRAAVDDRILSRRSPSSPPSPGSQHPTDSPTVVEYACDHIATITRESVSPSTPPSRTGFDVLLLETLYSHRPCQKSWNAPFVQWDRAVNLIYTSGRVKFHVRDLKAERQQLRQPKTASSPKSMERTIHPLQYIPSLNVDTLLNLGLAEDQRTDLLGSMLATPRYSDPLPHNWIFAGGGRVLRVDKVDLRFDRDVDESLNYWGVSTRGYVHLLAHHLCLPIGVDGLPTVFHALPKANSSSNDVRCGAGESCRAACRECVARCSYLPKASIPCPACVSCGRCMFLRTCRQTGSKADDDENAGIGEEHTLKKARVWPRCSQTYSSYHAARKVWDAWRRNDLQHAVNL